jgi:two-component system chemotaxis response regulator CheB
MHSAPRKVVLIGASTGGPNQIERIVKSLSTLNDVSIVIAQHMADGFLQSFAKSLQNNCSNTVSVIDNNELFIPSRIYICSGYTSILKDSNELRFYNNAAHLNGFNPDINAIFNSFVPLCKHIETMCVILTGIGDDGVSATAELSLNGARCITEDQESAIVDGMPSRARASVANIEVHSLDKIIKIISEFCE